MSPMIELNDFVIKTKQNHLASSTGEQWHMGGQGISSRASRKFSLVHNALTLFLEELQELQEPLAHSCHGTEKLVKKGSRMTMVP